MEWKLILGSVVLSGVLAAWNFYHSREYIEDRYKKEYIAWYRFPLLPKKYFSDPGWEYRNKGIFFPIFIIGTALLIVLLLQLFHIAS